MVRSGEAPEDSIAVMSRQALVGRLAQVKEQFRATSDILKVLTSSSGDPDKVFDAVVENARTLLNAAVAQIYLVKGATYVIARQSGMTEEHRRLLEQHPIKRDRGTLVGRVTIDRRIHHITDAVADPDYSRSDLQRMAGFRSMIGAPLIVGDEVVGALNVMRNRVAPFDDVDERVLATFAEQAALALRHVDLFAALESRSAALESRSAELARKVEQLEGLADVGAAISSTLVPDEMLATIVSHAVELSGHRRRFADGVRRGDRALPGANRVRHERRHGLCPSGRRDPHRPDVGRQGGSDPPGPADPRPGRGAARRAPGRPARGRLEVARRRPARQP